METGIDFLQWLQSDMALKILMCLDDPSDLIRASSVSRFWRHFVITNDLCKQLCMRMFPQLYSVVRVIEPSRRMKKLVNFESSDLLEWEDLERNHRVYASLRKALSTFTLRHCISDAIGASSTDSFPQESITNTLDYRDRILQRALYWSSKGQRDPAVPETLIYKLTADFCVITEINVQPFEAFFQPGHPIYSAKSLRFRVGHPKSLMHIDFFFFPKQPADDKFVWTYTSQEFPMAQENRLQSFKLSEPVLCIGGYLQIELLGRVQRQEMDGLLYICISHVQVLGRPLSPAFDVGILDSSGKFTLKYDADAFHDSLRNSSDGYPVSSPVSSVQTPEWWEQLNLAGYMIEELFDPIDDEEENELDEFLGF